MSLALVASLIAGPVGAHAPRWLLVGGGPTPQHNEVSIERNIAYVTRLLGPTVNKRVYFADGTVTTPVVAEHDPGSGGVRLRSAQLEQLDGAATEASLGAAWRSFAHAAGEEGLVLYFSGHGKQAWDDDNRALLWGEGDWRVSDLAARLAELPPRVPVVVIMVQCYSGGFANVLFEGGDPNGDLIDRDVVGVFASTADRPSAGCTPDIDERTYDELTTHFFGALNGMSRTGEPLAKADYDDDGQVGMSEALVYSLIQSDSIDVPTTTSEAFLQRFSELGEDEVLSRPYAEIYAMASPAQKVALDVLSHQLGVFGDDRVWVVHDFYRQATLWPEPMRDLSLEAKQLRFVRLATRIVLRDALLSSGDVALIARYLRLEELEDANPLPSVEPKAAAWPLLR